MIAIGMLIACFSNIANAQQCVGNQCQFATPVRNTVHNFIEAQPVRTFVKSTFNAARFTCSSNELRPGMVLPDGAVIISVGPSTPVQTFTSPENYASPIAKPAAGSTPMTFGAVQASETRVVGIGDKIAFRRTFLQAARKARADGKIDAADSWKIEIARWIPGGLDMVQASLAAEAVSQGHASAGAIDWDKLLNFLNNVDWEKIMNVISMIIKLFAYLSPSGTYGCYAACDPPSLEFLAA